MHFDDEVARLLADVGIGDRLPRLSEPADVYEWRSGEQQTLLHFDWSGTGPSGWPVASMFHQPALEAALDEAAAATEPADGAARLQGRAAWPMSPGSSTTCAGSCPGAGVRTATTGTAPQPVPVRIELQHVMRLDRPEQ